MGELIEQMISYWRDLMVYASSNQIPVDAGIATSQHDRFKKMAEGISLDTLLAGLDILSLTKIRLKATHQPRIMVEFGLIRLSRLVNLIPLQQILQLLQSGGLPPQTQTSARQITAPPEALKKKFLSEIDSLIEPTTTSSEVRLSSQNISSIWPQVIDAIGPMLGNEVKKSGLPAISGPNALVIEFPRLYNQALEYCSDPARIMRIQTALNKITGQSWQVRVTSKVITDPNEIVELAPIEIEPVASKPKVNPKDAAEKEPIVQRVLEIFNAQIVRVDAGFGVLPPESKPSADDDNDEA